MGLEPSRVRPVRRAGLVVHHAHQAENRPSTGGHPPRTVAPGLRSAKSATPSSFASVRTPAPSNQQALPRPDKPHREPPICPCTPACRQRCGCPPASSDNCAGPKASPPTGRRPGGGECGLAPGWAATGAKPFRAQIQALSFSPATLTGYQMPPQLPRRSSLAARPWVRVPGFWVRTETASAGGRLSRSHRATARERQQAERAARPASAR